MGPHAARLRAVLIAALVTMALGVSGAPAAVPVIDQRFVDYLETDAYLALLSKRVIELEPPPLLARCADIAPQRRQGWSPVEYPVYSAERAAPISGTWIERVVVDRCGEITLRRILVIARPADVPLMSALVPGGFLGNYGLEYEAKRVVTTAVMARNNCTDFRTVYVIDTRVLSLPKAGAWSERWTVIACGAADIQDVMFTPGADGTVVSLPPAK